MRMDNVMIHIPVLKEEVLEYLNLKPGDSVVDCTLGTAGHALDIAERIGPQGTLIGIDRDSDSLEVAKERLKSVSCSCHFVHGDFRHVDAILKNLEISKVNAMLFDLGISSFQLEDPKRGFSFQADGPLDMRMDKNSYISAYELVNSLSEKEISDILRNFGEERFYHRIAHFLVQKRTKHPLESTKDLTDAIAQAVPRKFQYQRIHPATRSFQAFRIAVNRELEALDLALESCLDFLSQGARLCVISFHSLEDRIVKKKFQRFSAQEKVSLLFKKPLQPSEKEIQGNPRARSARLRVAQKITSRKDIQ